MLKILTYSKLHRLNPESREKTHSLFLWIFNFFIPLILIVAIFSNTAFSQRNPASLDTRQCVRKFGEELQGQKTFRLPLHLSPTDIVELNPDSPDGRPFSIYYYEMFNQRDTLNNVLQNLALNGMTLFYLDQDINNVKRYTVFDHPTYDYCYLSESGNLYCQANILGADREFFGFATFYPFFETSLLEQNFVEELPDLGLIATVVDSEGGAPGVELEITLDFQSPVRIFSARMNVSLYEHNETDPIPGVDPPLESFGYIEVFSLQPTLNDLTYDMKCYPSSWRLYPAPSGEQTSQNSLLQQRDSSSTAPIHRTLNQFLSFINNNISSSNNTRSGFKKTVFSFTIGAIWLGIQQHSNQERNDAINRDVCPGLINGKLRAVRWPSDFIDATNDILNSTGPDGALWGNCAEKAHVFIGLMLVSPEVASSGIQYRIGYASQFGHSWVEIIDNQNLHWIYDPWKNSAGEKLKLDDKALFEEGGAVFSPWYRPGQEDPEPHLFCCGDGVFSAGNNEQCDPSAPSPGNTCPDKPNGEPQACNACLCEDCILPPGFSNNSPGQDDWSYGYDAFGFPLVPNPDGTFSSALEPGPTGIPCDYPNCGYETSNVSCALGLRAEPNLSGPPVLDSTIVVHVFCGTVGSQKCEWWVRFQDCGAEGLLAKICQPEIILPNTYGYCSNVEDPDLPPGCEDL